MAKRNKPAKTCNHFSFGKRRYCQFLLWLSENWNQETIDKFLEKLEIFYHIISINPRVFSYYNKQKNIRKFALTKQNIIYYRNRRKVIEIITVFDSRQNPAKLKKILK